MARTRSKWVVLFAALTWGLVAEGTPAAPQPQLLRDNGSQIAIPLQPESQKALELPAPRRQAQQPPEGEANNAITITDVLDENSPQRKSDNSYYNTHEFQGEAGDTVVIELVSQDFDAYLILNDPSGNAIDRDNNRGDGANAKIVITLPETGTYTVFATTITTPWESPEQGSYTLTWRNADVEDLFQQQATEDLQAGLLTPESVLTPESGSGLLTPESRLQEYREQGDRQGELGMLYNFGLVYDARGQWQEALNYYQQALPIARELDALSSVYNNKGQYTEALDYYQYALSIAREVSDRPEEARTLYNLARNYRDSGDRDTALTHIEDSIEILEELRSNIASSELRTSYFATVQDYYSFYIDLLMELHEEQPNAGYDARAFHASEGSRARSLIELMAEASIDIRRGIPPELAQREENLLSQLNAAASRRQELLGNDAPETAIEEIRNQIQQLETELQQVEAQIRQTSPEAAALKYPQPLTLAEVQERVLDEDTVLLQYSLGEERSFVWVVTPDDITSIELPNREEIARLTTELRWKLTSKRAGMQEIHTAAAPLSDAILTPIGDLGNKRLLIVADGILQTLPFSALAVPGEEEYIPLLVNHEIVQSPSSSLIGTVRQFRENRPQPSQTLAMIADPVFGGEDDRRATVRGDTDSVRSGCYTSIPKRLLGTAAEANAITDLVSSSETLLALEYDARRELMLDDNLSNYRIVHLATHGCFDETNPRLSAIALSRVDEAGNSINGNLWLNDIYNLNLPAELVVLSACQTALGDNVRGEGIVGLTRGFFQAGTSRLIASLWNVDDESTARLMEQFYQNHLDEGMTPSQALRAAQLQMWENEANFQWQRPYYWSAFIFQGEWN